MLRATKQFALITRYCGASKGKHIKRRSLEAQGDENKTQHDMVSVKLEVFNSDRPLIFFYMHEVCQRQQVVRLICLKGFIQWLHPQQILSKILHISLT